MIGLNKKITVLVLIGCLALLSGCKAEPLGESAYQSGVSSAITQDSVQNDGIPLPEEVFDTDSTETTPTNNNSPGGKSENENIADTSGETNSKTENQTQTDKTTPTDNSTSSENDSSNQVDEILKNNQTVELPYDKW